MPAATVIVQFDRSTHAISFPNGGDVTINSRGSNEIDFNITTVGAGSASAAITGVSFDSSPNPSGVFTPESNNVYGEAQSNGDLKLWDDDQNQTSTPVDYTYYITVEYEGNTYISDPKISNEKPPTLTRR